MADGETVRFNSNIYATQRKQLARLSEADGRSASEHVREALADYLSRGDVRRKLQEVKDG